MSYLCFQTLAGLKNPTWLIDRSICKLFLINTLSLRLLILERWTYASCSCQKDPRTPRVRLFVKIVRLWAAVLDGITQPHFSFHAKERKCLQRLFCFVFNSGHTVSITILTIRSFC